jgi:hypothetical protein
MNLDVNIFSLVVDFVILIGAFCLAVTRIYDFFAKPSSKIKTKQDKALKEKITTILHEELPEILTQHDLEVRGKYLQDRYRYLKEIKDAVLNDVDDTITSVRNDNLTQNDILKALVQRSKDILRLRIMTIYHSYKREKRMPIYEWEALQELYKDYKAEGGNSYIDKYYKRMLCWEKYDDEEFME